MIYEFAIDPALVARWHDRKEYLFFDEKFGARYGRIVSCYPKKSWRKLVWQAFQGNPSAENQNAKMRITELVAFLWKNAIKRGNAFPEIQDWLENAEAEHGERPFRAIIAIQNPRKQPFIICNNTLIEKGHELWSVPETKPTLRSAEEIARTIRPVLRLCRHASIVDPYFNPTQKRFRNSLQAILEQIGSNINGTDGIELELHTSIDRCFDSFETGTMRAADDEKRVLKNFMDDCERLLPRLIPVGLTIKVMVWTQKDGGEKIHNRYVLTDLCSMMLGTGMDEAATACHEYEDISMLSGDSHQFRRQQYSTSGTAFRLLGSLVVVSGQKQ